MAVMTSRNRTTKTGTTIKTNMTDNSAEPYPRKGRYIITRMNITIKNSIVNQRK